MINKCLVAALKEVGAWDEQIRNELQHYEGDVTAMQDMPYSIVPLYQGTAFTIHPKWLLEAAAARQKWIDQSQSLNLYLDNPDMDTLNEVYMRAWESGLKTTYYLRVTAASTVEKSSTNEVAEEVAEVKRGPALVEVGGEQVIHAPGGFHVDRKVQFEPSVGDEAQMCVLDETGECEVCT